MLQNFHRGNLVVDTRVCTHDLIKEDDWNDHSCTQKIVIALHALNLFIAYHKNDLKNHLIEQYRIIKFA